MHQEITLTDHRSGNNATKSGKKKIMKKKQKQKQSADNCWQEQNSINKLQQP